MAPIATLAVGIAFLLDLVVREPPREIHPVAWFGRVVGLFDRRFGAPMVVGMVVAIVLPAVAAFVVAFAVWAAIEVDFVLGGVVGGLLLFTTTSLHMLTDVGADVVEASGGDTESARETVVSLVGRDTASLSPAEVRSAAVESVSENLADGLVGPLLAFALGALVSLPVGVGAAAWVKAVNTLDSMLGYHDKPVGTASALLDDAVEWIPARTSAVLIAAIGGMPNALIRAREWAGVPASPNSGWPMATLAEVLDIRLLKPGAYDLRPDADLPSIQVATRGIRVVGRAGLLAFGLAGVIAWF